ncbi:MAG: type II toxin-antitoxin system HipA family toxin [Acidiferrobacterales bacterium]
MRTEKIKHLRVETPQGYAGDLIQEARYVFNYKTTDRAAEVSLVLPLRAESYASGGIFSVFQMNRPEGYLLDFIRHRFAKVGPLDDMGLLKITGNNQIGRLSYLDPREMLHPGKPQLSKEELIESTASEELFEFLVEAYFNSGISGFQPKVMMPVTGNPVSEKVSVITPTLIVKSAGDDFPFLAQNEFLCMEVARRAGLEVPNFWLSRDGKLFIVERFDVSASGKRSGVEDMCILTGKSPEERYQGSYEGIAKAIDYFCGTNSAQEKARFFEYVALSVLLKNGDAHLKNFSFIYEMTTSPVRLSPIYDVVTTLIYRAQNPRTGATKVDNTMALKIFKSRSYPSTEKLMEFGQTACMVKRPVEIIDRIETAKRAVLAENESRIDAWLAKELRRAWGCGLSRKPVLPVSRGR